jgi:hypothetical protein
MSNFHLNQNQLSRVDLPFEAAEWFPELDELQESGEINMFGAPKWLRETYGFSKEQSFAIVNAWMEYKS